MRAAPAPGLDAGDENALNLIFAGLVQYARILLHRADSRVAGRLMADSDNIGTHAGQGVADTFVIGVGENRHARLAQAETGVTEPINVHKNAFIGCLTRLYSQATG